MASIVFRGARIFDGESAALLDGLDVTVENGVIQSVAAPNPALPPDTDLVDCAGRTLMPGLIDAHVHVYAASLNISRVSTAPLSYLAHFAANFMRASLDRGFTTLRDVGGADAGLGAAIREGFLSGVPRLLYGGRTISQTGGHGDGRDPGIPADAHCCACGSVSNNIAVIADGADAVRRAVREELRQGAAHIKIMASGGVLSPSDPLDRCQYSEDEIRAAVEEAERSGHYVAAHCHPAEAVRRAAALGIRSIEHATLIDAPTADFVAERGAFAVPTMAIIMSLVEDGAKMGLPPVSMEKLRRVSDSALHSLEILRRAGVKCGYGTDLVGPLHTRQSSEFRIRSQVLPAIDVLRAACSVNAELIGEAGRLGCVGKGAIADLIVVDGNPLEDIEALASGGERIPVILQGGRFHKRK